MKRKLTITLAGILAVGALAFATPMNFKGCQNKDFMNHAMLFEKLNLSNAQKKEIEAIRNANIEQRQAMMGQNRVNFSAYLTDKGFDKAKFIKDKLAQEETRAAKRANNFERMYSTLTPTQKSEFIKLLKDRESKMQMMMKKRNNSNN